MYQFKGQGRFFKIVEAFTSAFFKISKKNNLKQKSYKDFAVLKINKLT